MSDVDNIEFPAQADANEPVEIKLAGEVYPFREPVKMRADALLAKLRKGLAGLMPGLQEISRVCAGVDAQDKDALGQAIMSSQLAYETSCEMEARAPECWPVVADALGITKAKAAELESVVSAQEVVGAMLIIVMVLQRPFAGGVRGTGRATAGSAPSRSGSSAKRSCAVGESPGT